jgi:hypothetical protein
MGRRNWVDADAIGEHALGRARGDLCEIVASAALWANPECFLHLPALHPWSRLARGEERAGETVLDWGPRVFRTEWDDPSNLAPVAVKLLDERRLSSLFLRAIGSRLPTARFVVRTIWPDTSADCRYATCPANLVALPVAVAPLLDLSPPARLALRLRSERLFGWRPAGLPATESRRALALRWRAPEPFPPSLRRAILRRRSYLRRLPEILLAQLEPAQREKAKRAEVDFEEPRAI